MNVKPHTHVALYLPAIDLRLDMFELLGMACKNRSLNMLNILHSLISRSMFIQFSHGFHHYSKNFMDLYMIYQL